MTTQFPEITASLVANLMARQFPHLSNLAITPVPFSGIDNRTFRLGNEMLIRMPSAECYAAQVEKEQKWLPLISQHLSFPIPEPIAIGRPSEEYPWSWSIYKWLDGENPAHDSELLALDLANFLNELRKIDATWGPLPGVHNYYRGDHPSVYDAAARSQIIALKNIIDADKAISVWEMAISSTWNKKPVWIHGDFASGNILVKDAKLSAVIDFGCMAVGDPAFDLVIAWTFLAKKSREIFKENLCLDKDTWQRASGWALWKATFELVAIKDKASADAAKQQKIILEIFEEAS